MIGRQFFGLLTFNARIVEITNDEGNRSTVKSDLNRADTFAASKDVKAPIFKPVEEWNFDGHLYGCGRR